MTGCSVSTYMAANNDKLLDTGAGSAAAANISFSPKANEIFQCEAGGAPNTPKLPGLKRKILIDPDTNR